MLLRALLFLLPAAAYARISIFITAGDNATISSVEAKGSVVELIPDSERTIWRLSDNQLKNAAEAYSGGRPNDVFLKSPTPWNDLYLSFGWRQVHRTLEARSARIIRVRSQPVYLINTAKENYWPEMGNYTIEISESKEQTVARQWTKQHELSVSQDIEYHVNFLGPAAGGSTSLSFTGSWGQTRSTSRSIVIGSSMTINAYLQPRSGITASLTATKNIIDIEVQYNAYLRGVVACNYPRKYQGHHFWAYDINACLRAVNAPVNLASTETISIEYYSHGKIVLSDKRLRSTTDETAANIVNETTS